MAKIIFIQEGIYENLGVMHLSAVLKQSGHSASLFIESLEKKLIQQIKEISPDIISFSVMTGSHVWVYNLAKELKKTCPKALILMGGPHPTFFPEAIERGNIDVICIGEGEQALLELANSIDNHQEIKNIANLWLRDGEKIFKNDVRALVENLDTLPFPDRELYYKYPILANARRKGFLTTRGCPYNCSFCFNHQLKKLYQGKGKYVRRRSTENIIKEILQVGERYLLESVYFQDDTFILDKHWLLDFLKIYKEKINLPFNCLVRADLADEETVRELKAAGCSCVHFGIEAGDERIRNEVLRKNLSDKQIIAAAGLFKKYRIKFKTSNIVGLPGETIEQAIKTMEFNADIKTDLPWVAILVPYPKTDISEMMREENLIPPDWNIDNIPISFFAPKAKTKKEKEILNLQRLFFWGVKFPRLIPLIRKLIKLPPNIFFDGLFYLGEFYVVRTSENLQWLTGIKMGINFVKINFLKKR